MTLHLTDLRTGIEVIPRDECMQLLVGDVVGRLAVVSGRVPLVFPVNYAMDGDDIVVRTDHGTKMKEGIWGPVSFEIDAFDRETRSGWSVIVTGRLDEVTQHDAARLHRLEGLGVDPWVPGERQHWVRLVPAHVSGRRVGDALSRA